MPNLRGKASAKKLLRKLMKEKRARCKAKHCDDKRHDITAEPVSVTHTVECSGDIPNEGLCDDFTEPKVASSTVCGHYLELCDVTEYVVSSAADGADPFVLSDPPECNDWSVWEHNPPELCDVTQFEVAATPEVDTTVRERELQEKRNRSKLDYYENHERNENQESIGPQINKKYHMQKNIQNNIVPHISKKYHIIFKNVILLIMKRD